MRTGHYRARIASSDGDVALAQMLRHRAFIAERCGDTRKVGRDVDAHDAHCMHVLVECAATNDLVATFRLLLLTSGAEISRSYSAQYYDLDALADFKGSMVEMGRFCVAPERSDPNILRAAWAFVAGFVDREGVALLFGCSSFHGTDAQAYTDAFAMLRERHLAPTHWLPRIKAPNVFRFAQRLRRAPDRKVALKTMPPLLRSYLTMGGWVSDHAVIDRELNTLHVFTGLEVGAVPVARARSLRALVG